MKNYGDLLDLHNSSQDTQPHAFIIIVKYGGVSLSINLYLKLAPVP